MCGNSHWPFPHRTTLSLTKCWYFSFCAALPQENFVVCPGMEFIAQSRSVPDSVRQKLELRGMWDPCLIANAFDSADEFQAYVEHVSVVLVALYDACCKWTDARVSLAGKSCSNVHAVSLVPTPLVPLAPPLDQGTRGARPSLCQVCTPRQWSSECTWTSCGTSSLPWAVMARCGTSLLRFQ